MIRNPGKETDSSTPYDDERAWPAFTIPELQYKELAINLTEGNGLRADECHFWNDYVKQLQTFTGKKFDFCVAFLSIVCISSVVSSMAFLAH